MTLAKYHAHPAISRSKLWWAHESPAKYKYFCDHPPEPSKDMIIGSAFHKLVLEQETFDVEYLVMPPAVTRYSTQGRTICEKASEVGKVALLYTEFEMISGMAQSLLANKKAAYFITEGVRESSIFWEDPETEEALKCRPDVLLATEDMHVICDLKSCASCDTENFTRDCIKYGYAMQAAMYIEGVKTKYPSEYSFLFFAVEKTPPYSVNILQMDQAMIDYGRIQFRDLLDTVHKCKADGNWWGANGKDNVINKIYLPAWVIKGDQ